VHLIIQVYQLQVFLVLHNQLVHPVLQIAFIVMQVLLLLAVNANHIIFYPQILLNVF